MQNIEEELKSIPRFDLTGYKWLKDFDHGNFGKISLAQNIKNNDLIAVKEFFVKKSDGEEETKNLIIREIKNISKCSSFNQLIIRFRGISFQDFNGNSCEYPLLVLDFAEHGSLKKFLKESKTNNQVIPNSTKMIFLYGIAKAMESIHFLHITHRDLNPSNILLNENDYPLVADMGISKKLDIHSSDPSTIIGTPIYEAPELLNETITDDECFGSDVFSYALIAYYIISEKEPYDDLKKQNKNRLSLNSIISFLKNKRFDLPDDIFPSYFIQLISLLWQNDPKERPTFGDIVSLFDAGIMLPFQNGDDLNKYIEYRKAIDAPSLLNEEKLIQNRDKLERQNKAQLANVITFFLADHFNNSDAQNYIGIKYSYGENLFTDENKYKEKAFAYFSKAAEQNNSEALFHIGKAYKYGIGCEKNEKKANECFQKSSELGYKIASDEIHELSSRAEAIAESSSNVAVLFGSFSSGKTTFINKIRDIYDNSQTKSTMQPDEYPLYFKDNDKEYMIRVRDTGSMEHFSDLNQHYFRDAKLAILFFDLSDFDSFNNIDRWVDILRSINNTAKLIIIGNKIDLPRNVLKVKAIEKAKSKEAQYFEISALTGDYLEYPKQEIINFFKNIIQRKEHLYQQENLLHTDHQQQQVNENKEPERKCC